MESARNGVVCNILSMAMAGGTSPVTLAGTLVTHNAEILGGLTLAQLTRRGAPIIYGSSTTAMDLKLAEASVGTTECALISGAVARIFFPLISMDHYSYWIGLSQLLWIASFVLFLVVYAPMLVKTRVDGRDG